MATPEYYQANKEACKLYGKKYYQEHKQEAAVRARKWCLENPDRVKNRDLKRRYGITLEQKEQLLKQQNNRCAICLKEFETVREANVDHNHQTKKVRGVLCAKCNKAIGLLYDDPEIVQSAVRYLSKPII